MKTTTPSHYCQIFRAASGSDCTNGGPSSRFTNAMLYVGDLPEGFTPPKDVAVFRLETSPKIGTEPYLRAVPVGERRWVMFGGNFLWTSDSRFRQEVSERPIPIHDRVEG